MDDFSTHHFDQDFYQENMRNISPIEASILSISDCGKVLGVLVWVYVGVVQCLDRVGRDTTNTNKQMTLEGHTYTENCILQNKMETKKGF